MKLSKRVFVQSVLMSVIAFWSIGCNAETQGRTGVGAGGGGHAVEGELLDFWENKGTIDLKVQDLPSYKKIVFPILVGFETNMPTFGKDLVEVLEKDWLLEPKALGECSGGQSMIDHSGVTVACQDAKEIRISKSWFADPSLSSSDRDSRQAGLIVHEMLRGLLMNAMATSGYGQWPNWFGSGPIPLETDTSKYEAGLRRLTRKLFQQPALANQALRKAISDEFRLTYRTPEAEKEQARCQEEISKLFPYEAAIASSHCPYPGR